MAKKLFKVKVLVRHSLQTPAAPYQQIQLSGVDMLPIQKFEWRWVFLYAAFVMILLSVPYFVGWFSQNTSQHFSGAILGTEDINSYFAKMNQGAHGAWLFTIPYSSEVQQGAPLYWFYLILGKISGENPTARMLTYHLARSIFGFILILTTYRFLAEFLSQASQRKLALIFVTLGGGLGWLLIFSGQFSLFNSLPIEFSSPEAYSFLLLLTLPHLLAARCLLLLALLAFLYKQYAWSGLALLFIGLIQPATVVIAWAVIGVSGIIKLVAEKDFSLINLWRNLQPILVIGLISAVPVLYLGYLFLYDPILRQWSIQNTIPSPHPIHYLSGYGIYLALALFGIKPLKQTRPDLWHLILGWTVLIPILINLPIGIQRRLVEGYQVPLVALAALALTTTLQTYRRWLIPLVVFMVLPTNMLLFGGSILSASQPKEPVFQPVDQIAAFAWLNDHAQAGEVALSSFSTGNALPAYTSTIAFIGHSSETVFLSSKLPRVAAFYQEKTDENERLRLITEGRIAYVLYGPHEQDLGTINLSSLPYLIKRFQQGEYSIYEVTR